MDRTISELRKRIEQATEDQGGRKRFPAELRNDVVELARVWTSRGQSLSELARRLGMNGGTLAYWLQRRTPAAPPPAPVRPVRVVDVEHPSPARSARTVVLPSGARIEGLTRDELLELVRALA